MKWIYGARGGQPGERGGLGQVWDYPWRNYKTRERERERGQENTPTDHEVTKNAQYVGGGRAGAGVAAGHFDLPSASAVRPVKPALPSPRRQRRSHSNWDWVLVALLLPSLLRRQGRPLNHCGRPSAPKTRGYTFFPMDQGASIKYVRKILRFFFYPVPPCTNWLHIHTIKFLQPRLLHTLFHDPPMRTYFMDAQVD